MSTISSLVIGRQNELQIIGSFLDSAMRGPVALVLHGEAGIGKTTLWEAGLDQSRSRGYTVLACRAAEAEVRLSYSSVADLLAVVDEPLLANLPAPQREALEVVLLRSHKPHMPVDHRSVATALLTTLTELSKRSPVVLAVDDLQWLDRTSAQALDFATRRMSARVGVLASIRAGPPADERTVRLTHPDGVRRLDVGPMSLGAIHHLLRERTGRTYPRPTLVRIHEISGGNPFFALEIVQVLGDGSVLGPQTRFPSTLAELTQTRLEAFDTDMREVLLVAAALARPTIDVLNRALRRDSGSLLERAEELGIINVAGKYVQFTHPILASSIYTTAPPAQRRAVHRRLARVVKDVEERARHLALAATGVDAETIAALDEAAENAWRRGAPAAAADLLELAIDLEAKDAGRIIRAAANHFDAGDPSRARSLLEQTISTVAPGTSRAQAQRLLANVRMYDDSLGEAARLLGAALAEPGIPETLHVRIELELANVLFNLGRVNEALAHTAPALRTAENLRHQGLIAEALAAATMYRFLGGQGLDEDSLQRALSLEDKDRRMSAMFRPSVIASLLWMWTGKFEEARTGLYALRRSALERGEETDLLFFTFYAITLECWRGDLAQARSLALDSHERALQLGTGIPLALALAGVAYSSACAGDMTEARHAAEGSLAIFQRASSLVIALWPLATLGFIDVSIDDWQAAARRFAQIAAHAVSVGLSEPACIPFAPDAVEALVAVGRLGDATKLADWLEAHGRRLDRAWALATAGRCRGLLLGAQGQLNAAIECCERALIEHERLPMPFERARTLLVLGRMQRRRGKRRAAKASLDAALQIFDQIGTTLWAEKARRELRGLGIRPGEPGHLTPTEQRVAELAAAGWTNREVAAALLISPKTVEANLARIYQKLEIRSRAELGRRMAERQLNAAGATKST